MEYLGGNERFVIMKKNILAFILMGFIVGAQIQCADAQSGSLLRWIVPTVVTAGVGYYVYNAFFKTQNAIEADKQEKLTRTKKYVQANRASRGLSNSARQLDAVRELNAAINNKFNKNVE